MSDLLRELIHDGLLGARVDIENKKVCHVQKRQEQTLLWGSVVGIS